MIRRCWIFVIVLLAWVPWGLAQATLSATHMTPGDYKITFCLANTLDLTTQCLTVNKDMCAAALTDPLALGHKDLGMGLSITRNGGESTQMFIWRTTNNNCTVSQTTNNIVNLTHDSAGLSTTDTAAAIFNLSNPVIFPTGFIFGNSGTRGTVRNYTLRNFFEGQNDPCAANSSGTETIYRLCIAIPANGPGAGITTTDPQASFIFYVDTKPPSAPTSMTLTAIDGKVDVNITRASGDTTSNTGVFYRLKPDNASASDACPTTADFGDWTFTTFTAGAGEVSGLTNGKKYQFCGTSTDLSGNRSTPTAIQEATPIQECNFASCFPGELDTGYCGAGQSGGIIAAGCLLVLLRALRNRRSA